MSIFKPNYIWVATGMKGGFKYEMLQPIKDFKIIAFPDKSEYNDWLEQTTYEDGTDFADVYINENKID